MTMLDYAVSYAVVVLASGASAWLVMLGLSYLMRVRR
jgi:hypothetical protein